MADSNISGLSAGAAVTDTDLFAGSDAGGGTLVKKAAAQIKAFVLDAIGTVHPFRFFEGGWWTNPVAVLRPTETNMGMTLDLCPNGTAQDCWIDIASTDVSADIDNYETLNLTKVANGDGYVETEAAGTGTVRNLRMQTQGGKVGIGPTIAPQNLLDVNGSAAFGSYAGNFAAPTNGLIISGNSGIGTSSPSAKLTVAASGTILSCQDTSQREIAAFNSNGTISAGSNTAGVDGILKLGTPSGYELVLTGQIADGHAKINNANLVGGNIDIQSQGTTIVSIRPSGLYLKTTSSITPTNNGELVIQATSNTSLTFKLKGSDGTVRSASLTLA